MTWLEFYLGLTVAVAQKSPDSTKHGCVITDKKNKILGIGFNGYPEGYPDEEMPIHREMDLKSAPNKYDITPHAEVNCVTNCQHKPIDGIAYVSGIPCPSCIIHLYQNGIRKIYAINRTSIMLNERTKKVTDFIIEKSKKSIYGELEFFLVKPTLIWINKLSDELKTWKVNGVLSNIENEDTNYI